MGSYTFQEFKGTVVTVVKLNPVRDYIAYGTERGFIRIERLSKVKVHGAFFAMKENIKGMTMLV